MPLKVQMQIKRINNHCEQMEKMIEKTLVQYHKEEEDGFSAKWILLKSPNSIWRYQDRCHIKGN